MIIRPVPSTGTACFRNGFVTGFLPGSLRLRSGFEDGSFGFSRRSSSFILLRLMASFAHFLCQRRNCEAMTAINPHIPRPFFSIFILVGLSPTLQAIND